MKKKKDVQQLDEVLSFTDDEDDEKHMPSYLAKQGSSVGAVVHQNRPASRKRQSSRGPKQQQEQQRRVSAVVPAIAELARMDSGSSAGSSALPVKCICSTGIYNYCITY